MSGDVIKFDTPKSIPDVVKSALDVDKALGWGVQSMVKETVNALVLFASSRSDAFRYALAVSPDIGDYLLDLPVGSITSSEYFKSVPEVQDSLIGTFDTWMEVHQIEENIDQSYLALLLLNDNDNSVQGYVVTRLRTPDDHIVKNILPSRKDQ